MKWYFCIESIGIMKFRQYIQAAVISCRQNTTLKPICLWYDPNGRIDIETLDFFMKHGVEVIFRESRVYQAALRDGTINPTHFTSGSFLRFDIPLIEEEDDFVLYTDGDVMFKTDIDLSHLRPRQFAAAPEFLQDNWWYFNSGVMLMNIKEMRRTSDALLDATIARMRSGFGTNHDQADMNGFYFEQWDRLPIEYNWKPYWGVSDQAKILHFHGPKPDDFFNVVTGQKDDGLAKRMISLNFEAYKHYVVEFLNCLSSDGITFVPWKHNS